MKVLFPIITYIAVNIGLQLWAQNTPAVPSFDQVKKITLQSPNGWMLELNPDGSGKLIYGSSDFAPILQQAFSFQETYNLLTPYLISNSTMAKDFAVFLENKKVPPGTPTYSLYLEDKSIIKKIMSEARAKGIPNNPERFKELMEKYSPVPDEAPEEKAAGIAACMANAETPIPPPPELMRDAKPDSQLSTNPVSPVPSSQMQMLPPESSAQQQALPTIETSPPALDIWNHPPQHRLHRRNRVPLPAREKIAQSATWPACNLRRETVTHRRRNISTGEIQTISCV